MKRTLCLLLAVLLLSGCSAGGAADGAPPPDAAAPELREESPASPAAQPFRYGRGFLDGDAAAVYDALLAAAEAMDWDARIAVPASLTAGELDRLLGWLADDNPRLYWLESVLDGDGDDRVLLPGSGALTPGEVAARDREIAEAADALLALLDPDLSERSTVFALHDLLIEHTAYERDNRQPDIGNLYGGLVRGRAVCNGFAKTYQYLLDRAGIDNVYISGVSHRGIAHAWNAARVDGGWCYVDVTWDSVASSPGMTTHEYLGVTHGEMALQHFPDSAQYPALPEESHPGGSYYEVMGYAVDPGAQELRAGLAEAFARQLADRAPPQGGGEQLVYLEIKLTAPEAVYEQARETFVQGLYELLGDMDAVIRREGWPVRVRTDGEILCSYNDAVQVLVLYPRAEAADGSER